jgi:hypothetical protein
LPRCSISGRGPSLFSSAIRVRPIIKDYTVPEPKSRQVSVLLVEDEALIRMMIAGMVEELGHTVVAEASNMTEALALARTADFEIAVLDINVGGQRIEPVADIMPAVICPSYLPAATVRQGLLKNFATGQPYKSHF